MKVTISRVDSSARLPRYQTDRAACFDLEIIEDRTIEPGETVLLRTGLIIEVPDGYLLTIAPRSSLAKLGLSMPHSYGIIDPDYRGPKDEIKLLIKNVSSFVVQVEKHQRLAQGYLQEAPRVEWREVSPKELTDENRGGFGSTGTG